MRAIVLLIGFIGILSGQAQAFDMYNWMREWQFELYGSTQSTQVTQSANPIDYVYRDEYNHWWRYTFHATDLDEIATGQLGIAGRIPILDAGPAEIGLQVGQHGLWYGQDSSVRRYVGAYVAKPIVDAISANAWVGRATYRVNQSMTRDPWWTGQASTVIGGIGLQADISPSWYIRASYEGTGKAVISDITYKHGSKPIYPPDDYQASPMTFHPGFEFRFGFGFNLSLLPSREQLRQSNEKRLEKLMARVLADNIPTQYQAISLSVANALYKANGFTSGKVEWDAAKNHLIISLPTSVSYSRDHVYDTWANSRNYIDEILPQFQTESVDPLLSVIRKQVVRAVKTEGAKVPASIVLEATFQTYKLLTVTNPPGINQVDYWTHLTSIELTINQNDGTTRVTSSKTETIQGGY